MEESYNARKNWRGKHNSLSCGDQPASRGRMEGRNDVIRTVRSGGRDDA